MNRDFEIGDRVICKDSGVIGMVLKFYFPTSCPEQTMVLTDDGRKYHAPTNDWVIFGKGQGLVMPVINKQEHYIDFGEYRDISNSINNMLKERR